MATHRATFTVTCDTQGMGYDDVALKLPSTLTRHAQHVMVSVDQSDAFGSGATITLTELDDVSAETWNDSDEDYELGHQLFYVDLASPGAAASSSLDRQVTEFDPRHPVVNLDGSAPTYDVVVGQELIRAKNVRCEVNSAGSADVFVVNMYYETAGDYRF